VDQERGHIVVGVDGSSGSRSALAFALEDAARRKATVEVVAAFAPPDFWVPLYGVPQVSLDEIRDGMQRHVERAVEEVTEKMRGRLGQIPPVTISVVAGSAVHVLLEAAEHADLLVVGSRGHGGISSVILGSVSMRCTLHATCPITIVHSTEEEAAEESAPTEPATASVDFA
jgi:nucleotide-binding universal stress UspA family protein